MSDTTIETTDPLCYGSRFETETQDPPQSLLWFGLWVCAFALVFWLANIAHQKARLAYKIRHRKTPRVGGPGDVQ